MRFKNTSETRPGFTILEADDKDHPGHHYIIQRKDGQSLWRVGVRETPEEPIRIIYTTTSLADAKTYAKTYRSRLP